MVRTRCFAAVLYFVADAAHVGVQYNCVLYFFADAAHVGVQYNCEKVESGGVFDVWISGCVKEKSVAFQSRCSIVQMQNTINDFLTASVFWKEKGVRNMYTGKRIEIILWMLRIYKHAKILLQNQNSV